MTRAPRALLAQERGDSDDALARLRLVDDGLAQAGWRCAWAGRDLAALQRAAPADADLWAAPYDGEVPRRPLAARVAQVSHASLLLSQGWGDADVLAGILRSWQHILQAVQPDLVVADGAPAAQWAATLLGMPVAQLGNEFSVPVLAQPLPALRWWTGEHDALADAHERQVLAALHQALPQLHRPAGYTIGCVADVLRAPLRCITSHALLLRPPQRTDALLLGPLAERGADTAQASSAPPGVWEGPAGHREVCAALARGDFLLLRPVDLEQWLRARWLEESGLAVVITPSDSPQAQAASIARAARIAGERSPGRPRPAAPTGDVMQLLSHLQALADT